MQLEKMEKKHYEFLEKELGMSEEAFNAAVGNPDSGEFDELVDELTWIECDEVEASDSGDYSERGQLVSELIDILCGPYDPDTINEAGADIEAEEDFSA